MATYTWVIIDLEMIQTIAKISIKTSNLDKKS